MAISVAHRAVVAASIVAVVLSGAPARALAVEVDWGVSQSGEPGVYTWQQLYNWTAAGQHLSPLAIPGATGDVANLHLLNLSGNQIINLDALVSIGTLNIGDAVGHQSYTIAAGTGGALTFNGGSSSTLNKFGLGTDVISANITLTGAAPLTIDVDEGALALTGIISGAGGITKNGDGLLILRAANTYTGVTTINSGMILDIPLANDGAVLGSITAGNGTIVNAGGTLAFGPDALGSGGIGNPAEPITINGDGFRNNGALRFFLGSNSMTFNGVVTLGSASRIQADQGVGTFTLSGAMTVDHALKVGGVGFVSFTGAVAGSSDVTHYGLSGFRMQSTAVGQNYSGTLNSVLGEIRSDVGTATLANSPYNDVAALNLKSSWFRIAFGNAAGAPTAGDSPNSRFSTTAPISMAASQIYVDNASFSGTSTTFFDYAVVQGFGVTSLLGGHNRIGFRSADTGSVQLTFADILKNPGTTLELHVDSLVGAALGTSTKHRLLNSTMGADVPLLGGWAYTYTGATATGPEFVKYDFTGGNGYTALLVADYNAGAPATWLAADAVRVTANQSIATDAQINALNIVGAITLGGGAGTTLDIVSGGLISNGANVISVPFLTSSGGALYDIAVASHTITSDVTGTIDYVKTGAGITSFLTGNSYTGTTFVNEGVFRGVIGSLSRALGTGNLTFGGSPNSLAAYENDSDFTRALGTGVGQVQVLGGGGVGGGSSGFNAYGAPININFGGAGDTVVWGSSAFDPGIFALNSGGASTHAITFVNTLDLGGEQRYIRVDGGGSGTERGAFAIVAGDVLNGSLVKRGGGALIFNSPKSYENGTIINQGMLWLRGTGTAGANVSGNDIQIGSDGYFRIESPANIGSRQMIIMQNTDVNTPAVISFGAGYGTGADIRFSSLTATGGILGTGGNNILIANDQTGQARRIAVTLNGNYNFQNDVIGQILAASPNVEAWFGADAGNGVFTGTKLTPSGGTVRAYRFGGNNNTGGLLTIANADVLTDFISTTPLIVGHSDQNDRNYTDGILWLPQSQSFSGQVTIGSGGILWVGDNGGLGGSAGDILLRGGELRIDVPDGGFGGMLDTQYMFRGLSIAGGTGTIRTSTLDGGGFNSVQIGNLTFDAGRTLQVFSIGTNFTDLIVNNIVFPNAAAVIDLSIGGDNSFQTGAGGLTVNGVIDDMPTGLQTLRKNNGGALVLANSNTYDGGTIITQGRLILANVGAAGTTGTTISLTTNNDRRSDLEFRINGAGPFLFDNPVATAGGNDGSTRVIVAGPMGPGSEDVTVQIPSLTIGHGGAYTVGGSTNSAVFFDGFNGYKIEIGDVVLNRDIALRTRGALTTITGVLSGAAGNDLEKNEQGTLWLNGDNTYLGATTITNGYLVLGHDNALGAAASVVTFRSNVFSQILASGVRTISRNFINTGTGNLQTIGGLDAGTKTFTGNINLSTLGIVLTSYTGGDTTFTGVISGGFGVDKQGNGTVTLDPSTGTGNTYTGLTNVVQGVLIGQAQATSGSPFGTGAMTILDAEVQLRGLDGASSVTSGTGALTVSGGARIGVEDFAADAFTTTLTFDSLARGGTTGTVTFVPIRGALGTEERFTFTSSLSNANGIAGTWAVHAMSGSNNAASYIAGGVTSVSGYNYGANTGDIDTVAGSTQVFNAGAIGGTLTADRSVFAFRTDASINLGSFMLNVGDSATPANGAGIILNGGADITGGAGGQINIGNTALSLYVDDAAVSSLNAPVANLRNNAANTLTTVFTKFGPGTLEIGAMQTFQGNIELNRGTLSLTAPNVLPMFGNLNVLTGSTLILSPGTSVALNDNNQEFGNISAVNPSNSFQFSAGTLDLGAAVLVVGREGTSRTFNAQILGGAGSRITKVGGGTLTLDNINGNRANTLDLLDVSQGAVAAWLNDQSWATPTPIASAIPASTTILLRGGTFQALAIGDSTGNQQRINIGNNIIHQGGDSILTTGRATGSGSNKLLVFNDLTLDVQRFLTNSNSTFLPRFDGTITLTNHARVQTDSALVLAGTITDGGNGYTLNKIGGSDLSIAADNSGSWSGGMVVTGGTVIFATRGYDDIRAPGVTLVPLATSNAGTGDIIVNLGSAIRITAPSNILSSLGQEVRIYGADRGSTTRVDLLTNAAVATYGLRALTDGSIAVGLSEGLWTTPLNQARFGNGLWGLSALSSTLYTATTLGASIDDRYIFNGTNAGVLSIAHSGVVTGTASVELGKSPLFAGLNPAGSGANIRFYGDQDYTGNTTIFRGADGSSIGAILELTGDSASPVFDVYGRLTLRGAGRLTNDAGSQINLLNLRPGGNLRLDYNMDVADYAFISRLNESNLGLATTENKLDDSIPLVLDGAGINLINSSGRVNQETVGTITVKGGAGITLERNGTSGQIVLKTSGISRVGQATLTVRENANELGLINLQSMKLIVTGTAPVLTNGIVAPWMINATRRNFLSYNADTGFTNAPFVIGAPTAGGGNAFLSGVGPTDVVQFSAGWGDTALTGTKNLYALRVDEESAANDMIFTGGQINIWSGGLILGSDDSNRVQFSTTNVYFGDGTTPVEGIVYGGHSTPNSFFGGIVTAANLTFDGPGGFQMTNTANAVTGTIQLNGGRLYLDGAGTQGTADQIILYANYANNFGGNQIPDLRLRHNSATTTYTNLTVTIGENVPYAQIQTERFAGSGTTTIVRFQNLNILGTTGPAGTLLRLNNSNSNTEVLGTVTIGGTSPVGMNVNANTWTMFGGVTAAVPVIKTGDGVLRWDGDNSGFTGGFTLNRGEWRLTAGTAAGLDVAGTGDVELNFGTVRMAQNGVSSVFTAAGQDISVNGQVTFIVDRNGGATAAVRTIGVDGQNNVFRTTNSPYLIWQAASFGDDIALENILQIEGSPFFRVDSADLFLRNLVTGTGTLNKAGIWFLHFDNNAANTWTGGFNNFVGITTVRQANATLGVGPVQLFAGSGVSISSVSQLGTTGLTKIFTSGGAMPVIGTRTIANFNTITAAAAAAISGTGDGVLAIDANQSLAADPLMATRDGGAFANWSLGSQDGGGNLTANSVTPWGTGGTEFRLGGGSSTLTVNPSTAGSAQFAGVGNRMILGGMHSVMGYGGVTFGANGNNTYGGGTLVTRARNLDGTYRGFILSLQGGAVGTGTTFRTPLGNGNVDVFGEVRIEGASGTAADSASSNANTWFFHGGSRLRFDNNTPFTGSGTSGNLATGTVGGGGRWADNAAISLFSAVIDMVGDNTDHAANREIVGDILFAGGSEIVVRRSTGFAAVLETGNLYRTDSGTLMLRHDAGLLGVAGSVNADRLVVASGVGAAPGQVPMNNNMVDPWIVSRSENQFLKYVAGNGFQLITAGTTPANYLTSAGGAISGATLPLNNGTEILNLATANATLGINADIYALRLDRDINSSADNAFHRIIIRSGGLMQVANTPTINPDLYFGPAGDGTGEALIWANNNTLQINGKIFASKVVKSGTAFLNIRSDQSNIAGNWIIHGGGLQFLTPGAQGAGEVVINGAHMTDNDNTLQTNELRYNFNSGTPDVFTWSGGKITVNDLGIIRSIAANDRLDQLPAIDLKTTGGGHAGLVFFQADASRHTIRTGALTLYDNYLVSVDATSFGPGSTSGVQLGSGNGTGGLNNQGLYDLRTSGDGVLSLGDNSATFTGGRNFSVGDGTVRVLHNGAFGDATITAYVRSTGAIEIAVPDFAPTAALVQEAGSIERWARSDARGTGDYTFAPGVHWQVFTDVMGPRTINFGGGSIMGYLPLDYDQVAVIQTIRSDIIINLTANSYLGQIYPAGVSNGANSFIYDMGKLNTTTNLNPSDVGLRGSYLVIDGDITGDFDLTKVGQDVIKLAGVNNFRNLIIEGGIIEIGREYGLNPATVVRTQGEGTSAILDLNGYNLEIAGLTGPSGSVNNSAFNFNTLIVTTATDFSYAGSINGSVTLRKWGAAKQTLTGVNEYQGGTILEEGVLSVAADSSLGRVHLAPRTDSLFFAGGTLETTANMTIAPTRGITIDAVGGTIATAPGTLLQVDSIVTGAGALNKSDDGTIQFNNAANDYTGSTNVVRGTLQAGAADAFAPLSRHVISGDATFGTLSLNGFDQTIGSLATAGPTMSNAVVALGANMLTLGNDLTQNAVYAGGITGSGIVRLSGNGAAQTIAAVDNGVQTWSTQVANGLLNVNDNAKLGSGTVTLGIVGITSADDFTGLNLQSAGTFANDIVVANVNGVGSASITATGTDATVGGTVTLDRNIYAGAAVGTTLSFTGVVGGNGTITVIEGGNLRLTAANTFGTGVIGSSGTLIAGGTVIRAGAVLIEHDSAAGTNAIALGDAASTIGAAVDRAALVSILGEGTWNPNGDGLASGSGGQDAAGTTGFGAFIGVSATIDGFDYSSSPLGTRILVAGEEASPERNGIYVIAAINGGTMNLVRADDFENSNQMRYGGQVAVTNGTYAGKTMFMFEEQIVVRNEATQEPIRFREDVTNPNVAVLQNVAGLNVANNINIHATNGTGTVTVGGSNGLTAGTGMFSGNLTLQDVLAGTAEAKTVLLASSSAGNGSVTLSGSVSEADAAPVTGDVLSIEKTDSGRFTLSGVNTYRGTTTVTAGTLQFARQVSLYNNVLGNWTDANLIVQSGATAAFNVGGVGEFTTANIDTLKALGTATGGFRAGSSLGIDTTGAPSVVSYGSPLTDTNAGANSIGFTKLGAGRLELTGANTYTGATHIDAGVLTINGSSTGGGVVIVNSGGALNGGLAGAPAIATTSLLKVESAAQFSAGSSAVYSHGDGVGRMNVTGAAEWAGGATMVFDFASTNADGITGAGTNWDLLTVTGLAYSGLGNITVLVDSWNNLLTGYGQNGGANDFDPTTPGTSASPSYSWLWVDNAGSLSGFTRTAIPGSVNSADLVSEFVIDTNGLNSNVYGDYSISGGSFWVSAVGNSLYMNYGYSAVPEPGSLLLVGLAGLGFAGYRRRKSRLTAQESASERATSRNERPSI